MKMVTGLTRKTSNLIGTRDRHVRGLFNGLTLVEGVLTGRPRRGKLKRVDFPGPAEALPSRSQKPTLQKGKGIQSEIELNTSSIRRG